MPLWFASLLGGREVVINGDGETSRDFCFVENVVQANLLASLPRDPAAASRAYNVAVGARTTLRELFALIREQVVRFRPEAARAEPRLGPFRAGDIRHSLADVSAARDLLGYAPTHSVRAGLELTAGWYAQLSGEGAPRP
jgi:UDP-N-acetylglucosamine 4-epimerase